MFFAKKTKVVAVTSGAVLLGAAIAIPVAVSHHNEGMRVTAVQTANEVCRDARNAHETLIVSATAAAALLAASEGQVADASTLEALATAIGMATGANGGADSVTTVSLTTSYLAADLPSKDVPASATRTMADKTFDTCSTVSGRVAEVNDALFAAIGVVNNSHDQWLIDQALATDAAARASLSAAIDAGEAMLVTSEGRVDDNTLREQLRIALDAAIIARDAKSGATLGELAKQTSAKSGQEAAVHNAIGSVKDAVAARGARIAAEQRAAAARVATTQAPRSSSSGGSPYSAPKSTSGGGSSVSAPKSDGGGLYSPPPSSPISGGTGGVGKTPTHSGGASGGAQTG